MIIDRSGHTPAAVHAPLVMVNHDLNTHNFRVNASGRISGRRVVDLCASGTPCLPGAPRPMDHPDDATGPATDLAAIALLAPEVAANLTVIWLGGFPDHATYEHYKLVELNGRADIPAWRRLLASDLPLRLVPGWPAPTQLSVDAYRYAIALRALERPIADYLADILLAWMDQRTGDSDDGRRKILWDVATIAAAALPAAVRFADGRAPAVDGGGAHDYSHPGRALRLMTDLDADHIFDDLHAALRRHPAEL